MTPTHAGQHHLILHARHAQGCGNNADRAAFALVFQKRKHSNHHSQRIHLDAAPCRMCHFYQYITSKLLIASKRMQLLAYATQLFTSRCFCFFSEMGAGLLSQLPIQKTETDSTQCGDNVGCCCGTRCMPQFLHPLCGFGANCCNRCFMQQG